MYIVYRYQNIVESFNVFDGQFSKLLAENCKCKRKKARKAIRSAALLGFETVNRERQSFFVAVTEESVRNSAVEHPFVSDFSSYFSCTSLYLSLEEDAPYSYKYRSFVFLLATFANGVSYFMILFVLITIPKKSYTIITTRI